MMKSTFRKSLLNIALSSIISIVTVNSASAAQEINRIVAVVGSSPILASDLAQAVNEIKRQLTQEKRSIPNDQLLAKDALNQLVLHQAQLDQIRRFGMTPTEATLNAAVLSVAKQQGFDSLQAFQQSLDKAGQGRYAQLRNQVAQDLSIDNLRKQQVMSRIRVTERDIDNFLNSPQGQAAVGTELKSQMIRIAMNQNQAQDPAAMQFIASVRDKFTAHNGSVEQFTAQFKNAPYVISGATQDFQALGDLPAELATRLSIIEPSQTTDPMVAVDGVHIAKLIDRRTESKQMVVPQYQTRHILISPSEVVSPEDAKQRIDQIYQRLQRGESFETLAATFSNDPGSANDGGNLGWVSPGAMVEEFEKTMIATPAGQISKPFESQFGWHILKVEAKRQYDATKDFQRNMAKQILAERQFQSELDSWLRELRASVYVDIKDPTLK